MVKRLVVASAALALALAGCSSESPGPESTGTASATRTQVPAAEPGVAPAAATPIGTVVKIGNAPEGIVATSLGITAIGVRSPDAVVLVDSTTGAIRQTIPTQGAPRHLTIAAPDGPVLVPLEGSNELVQLNPADGTIISTATGVGRQPHDAVRMTDGTILATNELGGGVVFIRDGSVSSSLPPGPVQPGGVAEVGPYAAVADVQGNGVWIYDGATQQQVAQAPVGKKLTHALGLKDSVAAFADTDGGAVLLERITPQVQEVARIEAPGNPYGLAFDAQRNLLYITLTASNILRVVDVTDMANPKMLGDIPTVQQPNSVTVDPRNGDVLITGSDPGDASSLQIIPQNLLPRA